MVKLTRILRRNIHELLLVSLLGGVAIGAINEKRTINERIDQYFVRTLGTNDIYSVNSELKSFYDSNSIKTIPVNLSDVPREAKIKYLEMHGINTDFIKESRI